MSESKAGTAGRRLTSGVADRLERAGSYLESAKGEELLRDAEGFVRRRPWLVAGLRRWPGWLPLVFKASSERRYESWPGTMPRQSVPTPRTDSTPSLSDEAMPVGAGTRATAPAH